MKRIGLKTYHDVFNFGGILQALALQKRLADLGYDNDFIELYHSGHTPSSPNNPAHHSAKALARRIYQHFFHNKKRVALSDRFKKRFMQIARYDLAQADENGRLSLPYDAVVAGSDQIWNYQLNANVRLYLLSFVDDTTNKISYASSFGLQKLNDPYSAIYKAYLNRFSHLSVRETSGVRIIRRMLPDRKVEIVLDPTLLLTSQDWQPYMAPAVSEKPYVLCYVMPQGRSFVRRLKKTARRLGKKYHCPVYYCGQRPHAKLNPFEKNFVDIGPDTFLSLFYYAQAVVTNSFHGIAFSVNFQKPFISVLDHKYDASLNSRVLTLLKTLGLTDHLLYSEETIIPDDRVDYSSVNIRLNEQRQYSENYLIHAIEDSL